MNDYPLSMFPIYEKLDQLFRSNGMILREHRDYHSYFCVSPGPLFGEVFRLIKSHEQPRLVFFNKLGHIYRNEMITSTSYCGFTMQYNHCFKDDLKELPDNFNYINRNVIYLNKASEDTSYLPFIKWVMSNAIKQTKEFNVKYAQEQIEEDFK